MAVSMIPIARPIIGDDEIAAVTEVLRSGVIAQGRKVEEFEQAFARFIGTRYAVAVNSGTAALHIALLAHGVVKGDEVITSPFTFIASANSILFTGARPVFADIDPDTFNISAADVEASLERARKHGARVKALMPVHLYGQPCDMNAIMEMAGRHGLAVIEDACQAHGAEYLGKKAGSFGTGCFSFYPTKNMTTSEGGIITTDDEDVARKARMIRNHGQLERYLHTMLGYNYRMTDIAAAIGLCQLAKLPGFTDKRMANAAVLSSGLSGMRGVVTPHISPDVRHVFHQYTIRITPDFALSRDELRKKLLDSGVGTEVYYPRPVQKQPLYIELGYDDRLPVSEQAAGEVLSLPVHPSLTEEDLAHIVRTIRSI